MSTEQNKAIVRRFYEEVVPSEELFVSDYVHHDPALPPELQRGFAVYKQMAQAHVAAFPDIKATVEDQVAEGDKVVSRVTWQGTQQGEFNGIPASGKRAAFQMISTHRFLDGKIAEGWVVYDALGMLQQLGLIPAMA